MSAPQPVNGGLCFVCGIDGAVHGFCDVHDVYRPLHSGAPIPAADRDNPELDGTDVAHPAWWRGQHAGVRGVAQALHKVLDEGQKGGVFGNAELQRLADRLAPRAPAEPYTEMDRMLTLLIIAGDGEPARNASAPKEVRVRTAFLRDVRAALRRLAAPASPEAEGK